MIVRADLSRGVQAANIVHAAGESSPGSLPPETSAVCLTVPGERELEDLAARLLAARVPHVRIVETEGPHAGQTMAVGLAPDRKEVLRRHVSALPLLR